MPVYISALPSPELSCHAMPLSLPTVLSVAVPLPGSEVRISQDSLPPEFVHPAGKLPIPKSSKKIFVVSKLPPPLEPEIEASKAIRIDADDVRINSDTLSILATDKFSIQAKVFGGIIAGTLNLVSQSDFGASVQLDTYQELKKLLEMERGT